jgi:hypothetical protein
MGLVPRRRASLVLKQLEPIALKKISKRPYIEDCLPAKPN